MPRFDLKEQEQLGSWLHAGKMVADEKFLSHQGDCRIYEIFVCTCGLLDTLKMLGYNRAIELFGDFDTEVYRHEGCLEFINRNKREVDRMLSKDHCLFVKRTAGMTKEEKNAYAMYMLSGEVSTDVDAPPWHLKSIEEDIEEVSFAADFSYEALGGFKQMLYWVFDLVYEFKFPLERPVVEKFVEGYTTVALAWVDFNTESILRLWYEPKKKHLCASLHGDNIDTTVVQRPAMKGMAKLIKAFLNSKE